MTQKGTNVPMMRTRAKQKHVASDRARRENVPRHILFYFKKIRPCARFWVLSVFVCYHVTLFSTAPVPYNISQLPDAAE